MEEKAEKELTLEEFITFIREEKYNRLPKNGRNLARIRTQLSMWAINAIATDSSSSW